VRILFINTTGGFFGGVEQSIILAAQGLRARGHHCAFVSVNRSGSDLIEFDENFSSVWSLNDITLEQVVNIDKPNVMYVHKFDHIDRVFKAAKGTRIVRMFHDHDLYCPRRHKYYFHNHKICTRKAGLFCYADLAFLEKGAGGLHFTSVSKKLKELRSNRKLNTCIAGSSYTKQELIRNGFKPDTIKILAPAVAPSALPLVPYPLKKTLLYVGQLIRGKGVDTLLHAYSLLQKKIPEELSLHIVGTGNDASKLKALACELNVEKNTHFHGWVKHDEITGFYDKASLVVVPSRWPEPFGMIGLAAMQRKRPVAATDAGGISDWLADGVTGYLSPPDNPEKLAEKIELLLLDVEKSKFFGENGYKRVTELFSYDRNIQILEHILSTDETSK
jgi:glycosyltransferase involved in cell wall biosynthesis